MIAVGGKTLEEAMAKGEALIADLKRQAAMVMAYPIIDTRESFLILGALRAAWVWLLGNIPGDSQQWLASKGTALIFERFG